MMGHFMVGHAMVAVVYADAVGHVIDNIMVWAKDDGSKIIGLVVLCAFIAAAVLAGMKRHRDAMNWLAGGAIGSIIAALLASGAIESVVTGWTH